MPVLDQLEYLGRLHDMTASSARGAAQSWITRLGLAGRESAKLEALSHGNQQRVQLSRRSPPNYPGCASCGPNGRAAPSSGTARQRQRSTL